jgi:hypothetical protein
VPENNLPYRPDLALLLPRAFPTLHWLFYAGSARHLLLHDTLRFSRKAHLNRGLLPTPDGPQYFYMSLKQSAPETPICKIRHESSRLWLPALHKMFIMNYRNSIYFDFYEAEVIDDLRKADDFEFFVDVAAFLTGCWLTYLDFPLLMQKISVLIPGATHTDAVIDVLAAKTVVLDPETRHMQPKSGRAQHLNFSHPQYRHHFGFVPNASILDLLFSCGPESWKVIESMYQNVSTV